MVLKLFSQQVTGNALNALQGDRSVWSGDLQVGFIVSFASIGLDASLASFPFICLSTMGFDCPIYTS